MLCGAIRRAAIRDHGVNTKHRSPRTAVDGSVKLERKSKRGDK
jgi:hypothetical protein